MGSWPRGRLDSTRPESNSCSQSEGSRPPTPWLTYKCPQTPPVSFAESMTASHALGLDDRTCPMWSSTKVLPPRPAASPPSPQRAPSRAHTILQLMLGFEDRPLWSVWAINSTPGGREHRALEWLVLVKRPGCTLSPPPACTHRVHLPSGAGQDWGNCPKPGTRSVGQVGGPCLHLRGGRQMSQDHDHPIPGHGRVSAVRDPSSFTWAAPKALAEFLAPRDVTKGLNPVDPMNPDHFRKCLTALPCSLFSGPTSTTFSLLDAHRFSLLRNHPRRVAANWREEKRKEGELGVGGERGRGALKRPPRAQVMGSKVIPKPLGLVGVFGWLVLYCVFSGPRLRHMEIPRLEVELAPGLHHIHTCNLHHSSRQHWILNPLSEARDGNSILMDSSRVLNLPSHNRNSRA